MPAKSPAALKKKKRNVMLKKRAQRQQEFVKKPKVRRTVKAAVEEFRRELDFVRRRSNTHFRKVTKYAGIKEISDKAQVAV